MTTPISSVSALGAAAPAPAKTGTEAMGSDTFLKLLVAQLKYQDPTKPADGTQFLAQTAQFQMVEKLSQLSDQNTQLLAEQRSMSAIALVGRTVSFGSGASAGSGTVSAVRMTPGGTVLDVAGHDVSFADVTEVHSAG